MHSFNILLTLSVALSAVQAHVARPRGQSHTVCYQDNQLRALERYSEYANEFCPAYLAGTTAHYPKWLSSWNKWKVSSACSCYEKTATSLGPSSSAALSESALSSAPPALTAVFASSTASVSPAAPSTGVASTTPPLPTGGYIPSGTAYGSGTGMPSVKVPLYTAPVSPSPTTAVPNTVAPTTAVNTSAINISSSTPSVVSEAATTAPPNGAKYPPQPPGAGPGKRGLCYDNNTNSAWSEFFVGSQYATYGSNGGVNRGDQLDQSFSYVPTIAVDSDLNNVEWNATIPVLIEGGTKALFGSNEPDNASKANLAVADAVTVHKKYMQPYYGEVQLGTPAITNGGGSNGLAYLEAFVEACTGCSFDFVNVHYYLQSSDVNTTQYIQALQDYIDIDVPAVQAKHPSIAGLPIFIGEVRPQPIPITPLILNNQLTTMRF